MRRGRLRRSGLLSLVLVVLATIGALVGEISAGWGPKLGLDLEGGFSVVLQPIEDTDEETLDQAIEIIRSRVDALGVAEPEITRQGSTIEVNLPGVTDRDRARELVGQTAELRFRPVLSNPIPGAIEDLLSSTTTTEEGATTTTTAADGSTTTTAADVEGQSAAARAVPYQDETTSTTAATTTTEPGTTPTTTPLTGFELTPREDDVAEQPVVLAEYDDEGDVVFTYQLGPTVATGEVVATAQAQLSPTGEWTVALEMRGGGNGIDLFNAQAAAPCFSRIEVCPTGQLAIVLDSRVVMAPTIQAASYQRDQIQISGSLTEREAKDLALVLRYGSLPVALEVQQTREVSATLGNDSLRAGLISGGIGLALVTIFMIAYYRVLGLIAIGSLSLSGALLWIVICWLGEQRGLALTLAGITGIIVSIGIAVDSNVVFYENLKEDVSRGKSVRHAVSGSFHSAFRTIVMADVASLIGAGVLYFLTVGSVRGFALFLGLSTLLDIIAAYFFMRPLVLWIARSPRFNQHPRRLGLTREGVPA